MAHGSPRLVICKNCNQYITVARFSQNPVCPTCNKPSETTSEREIKETYHVPFFDDLVYSDNKCTKITHERRR